MSEAQSTLQPMTENELAENAESKLHNQNATQETRPETDLYKMESNVNNERRLQMVITMATTINPRNSRKCVVSGKTNPIHNRISIAMP